MKILWFSNKMLGKDDGTTGTWLLAMANQLQSISKLELCNVSLVNSNKIEYTHDENLCQWGIPNKHIDKNGLPNKLAKEKILKIIKSFDPDLIHVWGVETFWGTITAELDSKPVLLEIQGIKGKIANQYYGSLNLIERSKCIGLKELITFQNIYIKKKNYRRWGKVESSIIKQHNHISIHSDWAKACVNEINPSCKIYRNQRLLRKEFYNADKWEDSNDVKIFTSLSYIAPFKGLYTLIKSLEIIKRDIKGVNLLIAGDIRTKGIRVDGYIRFIMNEIKKRDLFENVTWLGKLSANDLINQLRKSTLSVYPSYTESYGNALAESMLIGTPTVAAFNGGSSYLGKDEETVLFFQPGDYSMCAYQMKRILNNKNLRNYLSNNSRNRIISNNSQVDIINRQLDIYKSILKS